MTKTTLIVMWLAVGAFAAGCILFVFWDAVSSRPANLMAATEFPAAEIVALEPIAASAGASNAIAVIENETRSPLNSSAQPPVTANLETEKSAAIVFSAEDLFERLAPSVVTIDVRDESEEHIATGSGFFIDSSIFKELYAFLKTDNITANVFPEREAPVQISYVLTNYHVIRPAVSADIVLSTGEKGTVQDVIAEDLETDLALLSVLVPSNRSVAGMPLALEDPRVGATVYAIGSPEGLSSTLSQGIVSAFCELGKGSHWLQTTCPISHGSSGGPLLLPDGMIAGVTTLTRKDAQNINFAIPVSEVRKFLSAEFRSRNIAEGASIFWHQQDAFAKLREYSQYSASPQPKVDRDAIILLEKARQEMHRGHHSQAIAMAQQSAKSLPERFTYLTAYIAGVSSARLATSARWQSTKTVEEARTRYRADDNAQMAQRLLEQATRSEPDFSPAWRELVNNYQASGNWPDALIASNTLVNLMPRCVEALKLRAQCYFELFQSEAAVNDLKAAIELAPRTGQLYSELAGAFLDLREFPEAIASYERALELNYEPAMVHANMGNVYQKSGSFETAIEEFTKAKSAGWPAALCDQEIAECEQRMQ